MFQRADSQPRYSLLAIVLTALVGISRVYMGVHYPTDVLAGWCVGAAWSISCVALANWLTRGRSPTLAP